MFDDGYQHGQGFYNLGRQIPTVLQIRPNLGEHLMQATLHPGVWHNGNVLLEASGAEIILFCHAR